MKPKTTPEGKMKKSKGYRHKDRFQDNGKAPLHQPKFPPEMIQEVQERALARRSGKGGKPCLELCEPEKAAKALWMRAQGASYRQIALTLGVEWKTVMALAWRNEETIESKRKEFSKRYAQVAEQFTDILFEKAERLMDNPEKIDEIDPSKLALTVGIMTDKAAQLSGMATVTIEHRKGVTVEDAAKAIEEARKRIAENARARSIEAEIVDSDE